jgi:low affinity Fe/Cu permease
MKVSDWFSRASRKAAEVTGSWQASILAIAIVLIWAATGPLFGFSDTWQLICNTGTTIFTFIMVFLIQGSQNRDQVAVQIKLNEIIFALDKANSQLIGIENDTDDQIDAARQEICAQKNPPESSRPYSSNCQGESVHDGS